MSLEQIAIFQNRIHLGLGRKIILLLVLITFLVLFMVSHSFGYIPKQVETLSDYPCNAMANQSYEIFYKGIHYIAEFLPGPFGPGLSGIAVLTTDDGASASFPFSTTTKDSKRMVLIEGFANFYFTGFSLVWIQGDLIELTQVEPVNMEPVNDTR